MHGLEKQAKLNKMTFNTDEGKLLWALKSKAPKVQISVDRILMKKKNVKKNIPRI